MAKKITEAKVSKTKKAMGDSYGSGSRNAVGKPKYNSIFSETPKSKLKNPPKSFA